MKLREARKLVGMSVTELAEALGLSRASVWGMETGRVRINARTAAFFQRCGIRVDGGEEPRVEYVPEVEVAGRGWPGDDAHCVLLGLAAAWEDLPREDRDVVRALAQGETWREVEARSGRSVRALRKRLSLIVG